jgi:hypothetical protein
MTGHLRRRALPAGSRRRSYVRAVVSSPFSNRLSACGSIRHLPPTFRARSTPLSHQRRMVLCCTCAIRAASPPERNGRTSTRAGTARTTVCVGIGFLALEGMGRCEGGGHKNRRAGWFPAAAGQRVRRTFRSLGNRVDPCISAAKQIARAVHNSASTECSGVAKAGGPPLTSATGKLSGY